MSIDPRVALQSLVTALEEHLAASASRRREDDPAVEAAYLGIADAFEVYEEALYDAFGEVTPLEIYEESDDDDPEDEDENPDEDDDENPDDDADDTDEDLEDDPDDPDDAEYASDLIDAEVEP